MYGWIVQTYACIGHSAGKYFVVFVRVLIVLFRKFNSVWMDCTWIRHNVGKYFVVFVRVLIVLFRKSNRVWMDWMDICMNCTQCMLVSIMVVFVHVLICLLQAYQLSQIFREFQFLYLPQGILSGKSFDLTKNDHHGIRT